MEKLQRFSIRKLSIGAVSCLIGTVSFLSYSYKVQAADKPQTVETAKAENEIQLEKAQESKPNEKAEGGTQSAVVDKNTGRSQKTGDVTAANQVSPKENTSAANETKQNIADLAISTKMKLQAIRLAKPVAVNKINASPKPVQTVSPEQSADTTDGQPASDQVERAAANSNAPENDVSAASASTVLSKQPVNADTQLATTTSGVQPFMNLAVVSDNNDLTPKRETVDSTWTLHYVNQADHKQELKDPTVMTMQYTRTNTPQSDGTTEYGDWSYVPGSFKQTGTPITVKDSDNPVKQDNVDKNGENFDVFTITAMYPTVAGYGFYNGINGTRLHDNLRNNERQADAMSKDFYAEYDVAKPTQETVGSQWRIHYIDSTNHEHELKAPTVINMQYVRTNTPQSDGTIQHGDWSYVPGSFKQTGTSITVNDSNNPVKEDNVDKNGQNVDTFTINAMYPSITGYNFHDGINNAHLHDYLLNYDPNGNIQMPTMGRDFYVEYDPISERSVAVKFVDNQYLEQQVGQAVTVTGRDGDTVDLKLTVPDKYQLADGQQLPTTYTFAKGSGDLKIHLVHKVVQREATINFQLGLMTFVNFGDNNYEPLVITQAQWAKLKEEAKDGSVSPEGTIPFTEVGTLTGHVGYDLVDEEAVSFGDDWTSLNLGSRTYQLPNGTDVVNGILIDSDDTTGKKLKEYYLNEYQNWDSNKHVDPDYANRPWHGYLSVNATNNTQTPGAEDVIRSGMQAGLAGNESNILAKATGDRAATGIEMVNKIIDLSWLQDNLDFRASEFKEQDGQLQAKTGWEAFGVYIPYVEKTATRTIKVTTPDGKTTSVKQTATLAKQVEFGKDAHPAWTTGEWANYTVPTIPGYTASQSNVAKETVTGTTEDQTVNITYTANPQTTTVVYQSEDGTPVHTATVNGHTGQTVKVSNEVPVGWHVVNGTVPSEITFDPDETPKTVVTIAHQHVTVTPDVPKTTDDKLPDNPGKAYPAGVGETDLNKTVTRTIKVTTPDRQTKTIAQTAKLTRTADVDEVTGEVTYGKWTTGKWSNYDVPTVPGYTASQNEVPATEVTSDMTDQTIDISYTANSQTIHINYVDNDNAGKIVHATTVTGKTGETVNLNLTVPDKYQLANGQQLPTTYTFTAGSGDVTIHLAHKVVQREAAVDVQIGFITLVDVDDESEPGIVVTQNQWRQLDNEIKDFRNPNFDEVFPSVKVGTLTGHVNYDLVDNKVVSLADDWTSLNLGGRTYQMPDGTDVVNGIIVGTDLSWGEKLKEHFLNYTDDPDYVNRAWHGYLSVNKSNMDPDYAGFRLVGNEPNALAKVTGDRAATAIEIMTNKPIDLSSLRDRGGLSDFNEQGGQLRAKATFELVGMYIPYVEKTATRTINITTPDGKTTSVKQTATLAKRVTAQEGAHPDWTTSEWTNYDVPVIPGYTASQSNVAKEAVTGTTKDQTVNITYTANDGTQTIIYQDKDGSEIGKQIIPGKTGQTVKVTPDIPNGYVVKGEVPSEVTIKPDDTSITITIEHGKFHIDPDKPVNSGEHIPGTTDKTYPSGLTHDDLNKTITREVTITDPTGKKSTTTQTVTFTRGATVDEVTNEVTYDDWSENGKHTFDKVDVPTVQGYMASGDVPSIVVTPETRLSKVDITYIANAQTATITYIDDTEKKTLNSDNQNGKFNQTITFEHDPAEVIKGLEEKGYKLVSDNFNSNTYQADNSKNVFYVHFVHGTHAISDKYSITETVTYIMSDGSNAPDKVEKQVEFSRDGYNDEVTKQDHWNKWQPNKQSFSAVPTPRVKGYTPNIESVGIKAVTAGDKDIDVTIVYTPNKQKAKVVFINDTTKKILDTHDLIGVTNGHEKYNPSEEIKKFIHDNYVFVSSDYPEKGFTYDNDDGQDQVFEVHLKERRSESDTPIVPDNTEDNGGSNDASTDSDEPEKDNGGSDTVDKSGHKTPVKRNSNKKHHGIKKINIHKNANKKHQGTKKINTQKTSKMTKLNLNEVNTKANKPAQTKLGKVQEPTNDTLPQTGNKQSGLMAALGLAISSLGMIGAVKSKKRKDN